MVVDVMGDVLCRSVERFKHLASQDAMVMMVGGRPYLLREESSPVVLGLLEML